MSSSANPHPPAALCVLVRLAVVVFTYGAASAVAAVALPAILTPLPVVAFLPEPPPVVARTVVDHTDAPLEARP